MNTAKCPFTFEGGSMRIIVSYKNNRVVGSVSPHAMALASPVWKKFIFPPFRQASEMDSNVQGGIEKMSESLVASESAMEPVEELDFAGDPADALLILLRISHFDFISIPSKLPLDTLSDVAILCDEYDCVHLVKPWLSDWLEGEYSSWKRSSTPAREKWLFIAWVFGREQVLIQLASVLILEIRTFGNGNCSALSGSCGPMPAGLIECILGLRRAAIEKLLEIPRKYINRFQNNSRILCLHAQKGCDAITYGSLLRGLDIIKISPKTNPNDVHIPLKNLGENLGALEIYVLPRDSPGRIDHDHRKCFTANIKAEVTNVLASIGDPVLESHRQHMATQRSKLGEKM